MDPGVVRIIDGSEVLCAMAHKDSLNYIFAVCAPYDFDKKEEGNTFPLPSRFLFFIVSAIVTGGTEAFHEALWSWTEAAKVICLLLWPSWR